MEAMRQNFLLRQLILQPVSNSPTKDLGTNQSTQLLKLTRDSSNSNQNLKKLDIESSSIRRFVRNCADGNGYFAVAETGVG